MTRWTCFHLLALSLLQQNLASAHTRNINPNFPSAIEGSDAARIRAICTALITVTDCSLDLSTVDAAKFTVGTFVRDMCELDCNAASAQTSASSLRLLQESQSEAVDLSSDSQDGTSAQAEAETNGSSESDRGGDEKGCGEGSEDESHDGEAEAEETNGMSERSANVMAGTLVGLILVTICFELMHEKLEEAAGAELKEIVDAMYGELTVLGFIGLLTFISVRTGAAHWLGKQLFPHDPEGEEFVEMLESLHMLLFFVMVVFICEVLFVITAGKKNIRQWRYCERTIRKEHKYREHSEQFYHPDVHGTGAAQSTSCGMHLLWQRQETIDARRIVEYDWLKARFLQQSKKHHHRIQLDGSFDLAAYFELHQHTVFEGIINIEASTWLFIIVSVPMIRAVLRLPRHIETLLFVGFGWFLLAVAMWMRWDLRNILVVLVPKPRHRARVPAAASDGGNRQILMQNMNSIECIDSPSSNFLPQHKPLSTHHALHRSGSVRELRPEYKDLTHSRGHLKGQRKQHHHLFWHPAKHCCCHEAFARRLFAGVSGVEITLRSISLLMLVTAAYVAVLATTGAAWVEEENKNSEASGSMGWILLGATALPLLLTAVQVPHMLVDYVMASSIETMINETELHQTLVAQKTQAIVSMLKMLALARRQALMLGSFLDDVAMSSVSYEEEGLTRHTHDTNAAAVDLPENFRDEITDLWSHYDQDGSGLVDQSEFCSMVQEVCQASWHPAELQKMFSVIDTDQSGSISQKEFEHFMARNFLPSDPADDAELVFGLIDVDGDGQISATELRAFLCGWWSGYESSDPEQKRLVFPLEILSEDGASIEPYHPKGLDSIEKGDTSGIKPSSIATVRRDYVAADGVSLSAGMQIVVLERPPPRVHMSADEIDGLVNLADESGDGVISREEFVQLVVKHTRAPD